MISGSAVHGEKAITHGGVSDLDAVTRELQTGEACVARADKEVGASFQWVLCHEEGLELNTRQNFGISVRFQEARFISAKVMIFG